MVSLYALIYVAVWWSVLGKSVYICHKVNIIPNAREAGSKTFTDALPLEPIRQILESGRQKEEKKKKGKRGKMKHPSPKPTRDVSRSCPPGHWRRRRMRPSRVTGHLYIYLAPCWARRASNHPVKYNSSSQMPSVQFRPDDIKFIWTLVQKQSQRIQCILRRYRGQRFNVKF